VNAEVGIAAAAAVLGTLIVFNWEPVLAIAWGLAVGGAASNAGDQYIRGCVIDYLNLGFRSMVVNLGDIAITVGTATAVLGLLTTW
jgi:lipoprotein signal peptidase